MSKYQYKSITIQHSKNDIKAYFNISNLTDADADGFFEFDSFTPRIKLIESSESYTAHVKTNSPIIEFVELVE